MLLYDAFKSIAFKFDPEKVHHSTIAYMRTFPYLAHTMGIESNPDKYGLKVNGLFWKFPVGIAAGLDKNAECVPFLDKLGMGAVEVGTITLQAQEGNPRPRIWRLPEIDSLRNAMGFPSDGVGVALPKLQGLGSRNTCLGVNIGKNKTTSEEDTAMEYAQLYQKTAMYSDYMVINISSPNTPGLRQFQKKDKLAPILEAVNEKKKDINRPLFLKISPDLADEDLRMICELAKEYDLSGLIATNTTSAHDFGVGGLSGNYLKTRARDMRAKVAEIIKEDRSLTLIGVGGIDSYQDIKDFWHIGGKFVQIYTAFIYKGPEILREIKEGIDRDMDKLGVDSMTHLIENISK